MAKISQLLADDFDQNAFFSAAVELAVENLFPGPEVELAIRDSNDDLSPHHLPLDMRVRIVLPGVIVPILLDGLMRRQSFQEVVVVLQEAGFIVVDIYAGADVHRIDEAEPFLNAALP